MLTATASPALPEIIAFTGPAESGKTTAACYVVAHYPDFVRLSFAEPIRAMLYALGLTVDDLSKGKNQPHPILGGRTPREAMQTLGTEWGRGLYDAIWIAQMRQRITDNTRFGMGVVIDDLRFDNEAELIRDMGGVIIELSRPGQPPRMKHESERGISAHHDRHRIEAADVAELCAGVSQFLTL